MLLWKGVLLVYPLHMGHMEIRDEAKHGITRLLMATQGIIVDKKS